MTAHDLLFAIYAITAGVCAVLVVVSQNVVRMAFWLIISLGSTAGLFFLLGADFVGATQLLIYVGGTLVLLIFGVMLTASGPFVQMKTSPGEAVLGGIVAAALLAMLVGSAATVNWQESAHIAQGGSQTPGARIGPGRFPVEQGSSTRQLGLMFLGIPPRPGGAGYLLPFEIVSVHLLVVLIGAAYLARAKRRREV